jgi:4-alpha-glucanotransferase
VRDAILELVYASGSDLLLLPLQDAFGWRERVNTPGTVSEANWTYRLPLDLSALHLDGPARARLRDLAARNGRLQGQP